MTEWHEQDEFWEMAASSMFTGDSWQRAIDELEALLEVVQIPDRCAVLDLCCGPGRFALELSRRGFRVTGVDRTRAYLDAARAGAEAESLEIEFVEEDMRVFERPGAFDLVINMLTSFGYFEDPAEDRAVLANVHRSLKPGGVFVLDTMGKEVLARVFQAQAWKEVGDELWLYERRIAPGWSWIDNRWIRIADGARREFAIGHRLFSGGELEALARDAGFADTVTYGGFDGAPYDAAAERLILVARKAAAA